MRLRTATIADAQDILDWRNDSAARAMSANPEVITRDRHVAWLTGALDNPDTDLFIADSDVGKIGICRFEANANGAAAEVSINLNPAFRGRGLARRLLETAIALYLHRQPIPLTARIKAGNAASDAIFRKAGFVATAPSDAFVGYARPADSLTFVSVDENFTDVLYDLLKARRHSISHRQTPDFETHAAFVRNPPYLHWFLVIGDRPIGGVYVQHDNAVGVNVDPPTVETIGAVIAFIRDRFRPRPGQASKIAPDFFVNVPASHREMQAVMTQLDCAPLQIAYRLPSDAKA